MQKIILFFLLLPCFAQSQFIDDFSDGDFTTNPTWGGDVDSFQVNSSLQLQLNGSGLGDGTSWLSTTINTYDSTEWRFWVQYDFAPSSNNNGKIYLFSDAQNLTNNLNGYYLQLGESGSDDAIELFRQDGTNNSTVCRGTNGFISSSFQVFIKVIRNANGTWKVYTSDQFNGDYSLQASGVDNTYSTGSYMGVFCDYTSSRADDFYFDDFYAGPVIIDTVPPSLTGLEVLSNNSLKLFFSEDLDAASAQNTANYFADQGIGNPGQAILDDDTLYIVRLNFASSFLDGIECNLNIQNIQDLEGNTLINYDTTFTYIAPVIPAYRDIVINEIFADPSPQVGLPDAEFVEVYNKSDKSFDLEGWKFRDPSSTGTFPACIMQPGDHLILCSNSDTALFSGFGPIAGLSSWPALNNSGDQIFLEDNTGFVLDSVEYELSWYNDPEKEDGGWTLEQINPSADTNCPVSTNWTASMDSTGGTPGEINSVYSTSPDTSSPQILHVEVMENHRIKVVFSESMFFPSINNPANFLIDHGIGQPDSVNVNNDYDIATLFLPTTLVEGTIYQLTVSNASDCSGNPLLDNTTEFYFSVPGFKDVIITEIFADPEPIVGLPEAEFIEIYNKSQKPFQLAGWSFTDESTTGELPAKEILPGEYMILCHEENTALFSSYGEVAGIESFPSLNNSGETITLLDDQENLIDTVYYDISWYNDPEKDNGGWTLELINPGPNAGCPPYTNWTASENPQGGTPATQNSVYSNAPDTIPPEVASVFALSDTSLIIRFNEAMDDLSIPNTVNYSVDHDIGNPTFIHVNGTLNEATLYFNTHFQEGVVYHVTISGQYDCSGNAMPQTTKQFFYSVPQYKDIIVNEIFADPTPQVALPEAEFVELYNKTGKPFNLKGFELGFNTSTKELHAFILQPDDYVIICDEEDSAGFAQFGDVTCLESFPSLTNSGGTVYLFDNNQVMIDSVSYEETWYKDEEKEDGGWTLELMNPNPNPNCPDINNWAASVNENGGTPGMINSIYSTAPDTIQPTITNIKILNELQLEVAFSEPLNEAIATETTNFSINNDIGNPLAIEAFNSFTRLVLALSQPLEQEVFYTLSTQNLSDCSGNMLSPSEMEFVFYLPHIYDVVSNEIMADPKPAVELPEADYLELYNTTAFPINLENWSVTIGGTRKTIEEKITIFPNDYVLLCDDDDADLFTSFTDRLYAFSSFSLTDAGTTIVIEDAGSKIIHFVDYSEDWYHVEGKKEGGWSLEQIDPLNPCGADNNWQGANDPSGGTPGKENSVYDENTDMTAPILTRVSYIDTNTIVAYFDEILDTTHVRSLNSYHVDQGIGNPIDADPIFPDYSSVSLEFVTPFEKDVIYTLTVSDSIRDCVGNLIPGNSSAKYAVPDKAEENDLIINEILFEPKDDGVDFVEFYNNSEKVMDMRTLRISSWDNIEHKPQDMEIIAPKGWLLFPKEYLVLTGNPIIIKKQYIAKNPEAILEVQSLPSFPNSEGDVVIAKIDSTVIDRLHYTSDMHFTLINNTEGISLERINFDTPTQETTNWISASEEVGFATPGYLNSQYSNTEAFSGKVSVEPEIFSPDNDGYNDVLKVNYRFKEPGFTANISIYDSKGRQVKQLTSNKLLGTREGSIYWDGIKDNGEKANIGIYIVYVEIFNMDGDVKHYKKTAVLGSKL